MKDVMQKIEEYTSISIELDGRGEELKLDGKIRAAKKLQILYLELMPYVELYKTIPAKERQTIKVIIKEEETYSKSPFIYLGANRLEIELCVYENGHKKMLHETINLGDDDYRCFCILTPLIQELNIKEIKDNFKKEIIKAINMATKNKYKRLIEIEKALSCFDAEDEEIILRNQLFELFNLKKKYEETYDEFCLSLVLNQIERIEKLIEGGEN